MLKKTCKSDSTYCTIIHLNSAKIWFDIIVKETISIFKDQRFDSMLQKFTSSLIHICSNHTSAARASSSIFPLRHILANPALQSSWLECHVFHTGSVILIQKFLNLLLELINALWLHVFTIVGKPSKPPPFWTSSSMQQCFNRRADRILEWLGHVGLCLYAKGQVQVLQAWQIWGTPFLHLTVPQLALQKLWDDLAPFQCYSKRLSQKRIAVILVRCDKHVPGIRNISKTGQFHPWK